MPTTDTNMYDQHSFNLIQQGGKLRDQGVTLLYRKYAAHFRKFYLYQGLNAADTDDIVQETFVNVVWHCTASSCAETVVCSTLLKPEHT